MTKTQKKKVALVVLLIAAAALLIPKLWQPDLRTELAKVLREDPKQLVLNVPPADGLVPGSVFVKDNLRLIPLKRMERSEAAIKEGTTFELGWSQLADAAGKGSMGSGALGAMFGDTENAKIEVRATQCKVLDMDVAEIEKRVKTQEVMDLAADESKEVTVIVRAYEGILETKLNRTSKASAEAWKELQDKAKSAESATTTAGKTAVEIRGSTNDELVVAWKVPVVFACVVQKVSFFATHLGSESDGVKLDALDGSMLAFDPTRGAQASVTPEKPWALFTIASGYYPKNAGLRQEWNAVSAEVFEAAVQPWKPAVSKRAWAIPAAPLNREALLAEVRDFFPLPVLPGLNGR